ncbi:MAG TPA: hypothetical protein VHR15_14250 [Ktedonobacterales bacterium]|jgi:hypothetical protein|nr:hypothetical protein [Ktedonobacterales bacterium]
MSSNEQTIGADRQTPPSGAAMNEQLDVGPEDQLARLRRVALPLDQRKVGQRQSHGVAGAVVRALAGISAYCLPVIALCVALGALGYSLWVVADVARSAGSLDFSRVQDAFGQIDDAARAFMASIAYTLLVLTLYLLAAAVRAGETWLPLVVALIVATPVVLVFTLSIDLALSLAPAGMFPAWSRAAAETVIVAHTIFLAVLLRARRPVTQALNHLAFTRRHDAGILYNGELPRLHVIRFATGAHPVASPPAPQLLNAPAHEEPIHLAAQSEEATTPVDKEAPAEEVKATEAAPDTTEPDQADADVIANEEDMNVDEEPAAL